MIAAHVSVLLMQQDAEDDEGNVNIMVPLTSMKQCRLLLGYWSHRLIKCLCYKMQKAGNGKMRIPWTMLKKWDN